jgi:hypothetical protein
MDFGNTFGRTRSPVVVERQALRGEHASRPHEFRQLQREPSRVTISEESLRFGTSHRPPERLPPPGSSDALSGIPTSFGSLNAYFQAQDTSE